MGKTVFICLVSCLLVLSLGEVQGDSFPWLDSSSVSNNQNKCQNGPVTCTVSRLLNDLSKLLSYAPPKSQEDDLPYAPPKSLEDDLPTWVSFSERRLVEVEKPRYRLGHIVVDKNGSSPYKTIGEAIRAANARRTKHKARIVIHVKKGIYEEKVVIPRNLTNVMIIGDGINSTIITGRKHVEKPGDHTFATATLSVEGDGFIAKNMTVRNEAGPGSQAVALYSAADRSVFYKCSIEGFQDTLLVHSKRQFYSKCDIYGTTDIIFGGAKVVFQDCNIYVRRSGDWGENFIAAPGGAKIDSGIVIQNSRIRPAPELVPLQKKFRTYLGRPWRDYARLVYIECDIGDFIDPQGWFTTRTPETKGVHFIEFMSHGHGSNTSARFKAESYQVATRAEDVRKYTVGRFLNGGSWIPESNVKFVPGFVSARDDFVIANGPVSFDSSKEI